MGIDQTQLDLRRPILPRMSRVWFRYDPPVLIIGVTWHQTSEPFIDYFHRRLALSYHDVADLPEHGFLPGQRICQVGALSLGQITQIKQAERGWE